MLALLRQRGAMTRTVPPNTSARAAWLLGSLIDRALSHWVRAPPLDVEETLMMTQIQEQTPQHQMMTVRISLLSLVTISAAPKLLIVAARLFSGCLLSHVPACFGTRSSLRRPRRLFWGHHRLLRPRSGALRAACFGSATPFRLTVGQQARRRPFLV